MPPARFPEQDKEPPTYEAGPVIGSTSTLLVRAGLRTGARGFRRKVTLVTLRRDIPRFAEQQRAFEEALAAFAALDDPGVLRIDDISETAGRPFAAAPPLTGTTLSRFLSGPGTQVRAVSVARAAEIVQRLSMGVQSIRGALAKPCALANLSADAIWLTSAGEALLLPNVACRPVSRPHGSQQDAGRRYRAPELEEGAPGDARSDVYSLALLFWDVLAGGRSRIPDRANPGEQPSRRAVDDGVLNLVLRSLSTDQAARPADPGVFAVELAALVSASIPTGAAKDRDVTVEIDTDEIYDLETPDPETVKVAAATAVTRSVRSLRVVRGEAVPQALSVGGTPRRWIVGRARSADLAVLDPDVSREHFEISEDQAGVLRITDLGSKNGLFVNGVSVHDRAVGPGDEVHVGTTVLRFEP